MSAFDKECPDGDRSSDCEENLYGNEARDAVEAACGGNAGDGQCVCSFILLIDRTIDTTKEIFPTLYYVGRTSLLSCMHISIQQVQCAILN